MTIDAEHPGADEDRALAPPPLTVRPIGERAVLAEYADTATVLQVASELRDLAPTALLEVVPAERTLLLSGTALSAPGELSALLVDLPVGAPGRTGAGEVVIPVVYDGQDLDSTAAVLGISRERLVQTHCATTWTAAFGGFAPGFAYLLPETAGGGSSDDAAAGPDLDRWSWPVPRREEPRASVPAGSVALAAGYSGIYPRPSPGGWQLIGRTDAVLFDAARQQPALLTPGTRVRFESRRGVALLNTAGRLATAPTEAARRASAVTAALARRTSGGSVRVPRLHPARPVLVVESPGPRLLVEDGGRTGHAGIGVSRSGAFDRGALARANRAVGNPPFAPALEALLGPVRLRATAPSVIAIAGAPAGVAVTRHDVDSGHLDVAAAETREHPIALDPGDTVEIGPVAHGLRIMVAVRGGIEAEPVLGSASRDTLSGLGPEPLEAGDQVLVGPERGLDAVPWCVPGGDGGGEDVPAASGAGQGRERIGIPVVLGPRHSELGAATVGALLAREWTVRADSDRVGVRLDGEALPVPDGSGTLPSEPMVPGAIQVPPSGLPVVFGPDHPATGGYPVIGVLTPRGLDLLAQAAPGTTLRFREAAPR